MKNSNSNNSFSQLFFNQQFNWLKARLEFHCYIAPLLDEQSSCSQTFFTILADTLDGNLSLSNCEITLTKFSNYNIEAQKILAIALAGWKHCAIAHNFNDYDPFFSIVEKVLYRLLGPPNVKIVV